MCELCNGTHVIQEMLGYGYRISGCLVCLPEPIQIQNAKLDKIIAWAEEIEREANHEITNHQR